MPVIGRISVGDGATFTPSVDSDGVLSWSNNKNLENPEDFDIPAKVINSGAMTPGSTNGTIAFGGNDVTVNGAPFLPLAGGTMLGNIEFVGLNDHNYRIYSSGDGSYDIGWNYSNRTGSLLALRSVDYTGVTGAAGRFELMARDGTNSKTLLGSPDGTLTWDGKNVARDVKTGSGNGTISVNGSDVAVKGLGSRAYDSTAYLPLSGGTLTGDLSITTNGNYPQIYTNSNAKRLSIVSGNNIDNTGPSLSLYGQSYSYGGSSEAAGQFILAARKGSTYRQLLGKSDGTLTWGGDKVQTAKVYTTTVSPASEFRNYGSYPITLYRIGNMVQIYAIVSPQSELTDATHTICTLPSGYRPIDAVYDIKQGSGTSKWLLSIRTNGTVEASRYGTTSSTTFPSGAWMPFSAVFITSNEYPS